MHKSCAVNTPPVMGNGGGEVVRLKLLLSCNMQSADIMLCPVRRIERGVLPMNTQQYFCPFSPPSILHFSKMRASLWNLSNSFTAY